MSSAPFGGVGTQLAHKISTLLQNVIAEHKSLRKEYADLLAANPGPLPHPIAYSPMREKGKDVLYKSRDPRDPDQSLEPLSEEEGRLVTLREELLTLRNPFHKAHWMPDSAGTVHRQMNHWRQGLFGVFEQLQGILLRDVLLKLTLADMPLLDRPQALFGDDVLRAFDKQIESLQVTLDSIEVHDPSPIDNVKLELETPLKPQRLGALPIPKDLSEKLNRIRRAGKTMRDMCDGSGIKDQATMRKLLSAGSRDRVLQQTIQAVEAYVDSSEFQNLFAK